MRLGVIGLFGVAMSACHLSTPYEFKTGIGNDDTTIEQEASGSTLIDALTYGAKGVRIGLHSLGTGVKRSVLLGGTFTLPSSYRCRYYQIVATRGHVQDFRNQLACASQGGNSWKSVNLLSDSEMVGDRRSPKWINPRHRVRVGSGFFVTHQGHVFTSAHVVQNCLTIYAIDTYGSTAEGVVIGLDENTDLAVISTGLESKHVVHPYLPSRSGMGETVTVYGNPANNNRSVIAERKMGTVKRNVGYDNNPILFTLDMSLDNGYSGGPVVTDSGGLVGVVHGADREDFNTSYAIWGGVLKELVDLWGIPVGRRQSNSPYWSPKNGEKASVSIRCNLQN